MAKQKVQRFENLAANWTADNPILPAGWEGIESDTDKWKAGDGLTRWNALAYVSSGAAIGVAVTGATQGSVFFAGAGGVLAQDNAGFSFNDATNALSITAPTGGSSPVLNLIGASDAYYADVLSLKTVGYGQTCVVNIGASQAVWYGGSNSGALFGIGRLSRDWIPVKLYGGDTVAARVTFDTMEATTVGAKITLAAAQTADAFQVFASDGTTKLFNIGPTGYIETIEQTAPSAPAANGVRIYAVDNGAGKTQLMALFSSGAAQQIAIQP